MVRGKKLSVAFQFLLVRLKDAFASKVLTSQNFISIPTGAIKSIETTYYRAIFITISIPTGAIKR